MNFKILYKRFGSSSILIEWTAVINETILDDILNFQVKINNWDIEKDLQMTHAYHSLLVNFYDDIDFDKQVLVLKEIYNTSNNRIKRSSKLWRIPVCYDISFGIDLKTISLDKKMSKDDIIKRHSQAIYTVYFIGFLPGFLYLGGLDDAIAMPRKETPRLNIDKGAVAIGGDQTGVYPNTSPGGWNIIGNSPINFFDVTKTEPCFVNAGDKIEFYPVSLKAHNDIKTLVDVNVYIIESKAI
jgi:inhibitor of KinA